MDDLTRVALISDLFFNYQNENYSRLDWAKGPTQEQVNEAIAADAQSFAKSYFDLLVVSTGLKQTVATWKDENAFADWAAKNFLNRL